MSAGVHGSGLPAGVLDELRRSLPGVAAQTVATLTDEVAEYRAPAIGAAATATIGRSVELALATFLDIAARDEPGRAGTPSAVLEAAYALGRGEARAGRSMEALLAAYRVGARVAWQEQSELMVRRQVPAATIAAFAQLVFAYIDELSGASVAGHRDELATSGRVREQLLERLAQALLAGEPSDEVAGRAERAAWTVPESLTVVLLNSAHAGTAVRLLDPDTLRLAGDLAPALPDRRLDVLLVPGAPSGRRALLDALAGRGAVAGPTRPWHDAHVSYRRAVRTLGLAPPTTDGAIDTEDHLVALVLGADPDALLDLRARALAPLQGVRPSTAARLQETLRSWLLHQGRRELVAADLAVHAQTVRYRMTQVRELFGERVTQPETALELIVALGLPAGEPLNL
jgi:hypothetical protein